MSRDRRGAIQLFVREGAYCLRGGVAIVTQELKSLFLADRCVFARVFRVHLSHGAPCHSGHRLPGGEFRGEVDLDRVDARHVVNDDTDLTAVRRDHGPPLGVRQSLRIRAKRVGALFDSLSKCR